MSMVRIADRDDEPAADGELLLERHGSRSMAKTALASRLITAAA